MANNRIETTELDFDGIKQSLKTFLQGQSEFSDYDFEGSGLSVLLDVLAYNTHYNSLYTNLAVNEAFIDSAAKRASVVSKAKELGYIPQSAKCSEAVVTITFINNQVTAPATIEIPALTPLTTVVDGVTYTFYTKQSHIGYKVGNQYVIQNVSVLEGIPLEYKYTVSTNTTVPIPNPRVDLNTLTVVVQENATSSTTQTFITSASILDVESTSPVYFIKENDKQLYEVEFGNGVVGKALVTGNVVTLSYFVCNEDKPNGAKTFTYAGTLPANTSVFVTTQTSAIGGAGAEGTEAIRWNAPRAFAAQNRCVSSSDYRTIITSLYPGIRAINVWGGEDNTPPVYGKVFISIVPETTDLLSDDEKFFIIDEIIKPRRALAIIPEILDPIYIDVQIDLAYYYNPALTTRNAGDITALVEQTVESYNDTYLNSFGSVFKYSKLSSQVDATEKSIQSNIMRIKLHREIVPEYNVSANYYIYLNNPIYNSGVPEESILSSAFFVAGQTSTCYIEDRPRDDGVFGDLVLFFFDNTGEKSVIRNCGYVEYSTGKIIIEGIQITSLRDPIFKLVIKPQSNDVVATRNQFVRILPELTTITPVIDSPNKTYTFTSSRN